MTRKHLAAGLCALLLALTGCDAAVHNRIYDDDAAIAAADSMTAMYSVGNRLGDTYRRTETLTGSDTIWEYEAEAGDEVLVRYTLAVESGGKAKLVYVAPDDTVTTLVEITDHTQQEGETLLPLGEGTNRVKVVASDKVKLELSLQVVFDPPA